VEAGLTTLGLAFGLAMDAFTVGIAVGIALGGPSRRQVFRLAFHFGLFQFMMPILGWLAAEQASVLIESVDHWIAFGLLAYLGGKMVIAGARRDETALKGDPTRGASLVVLSVATSIDALAVGLSLRFMGIGLWTPCIVIGLFALAMTTVGMFFGRLHLLGMGARAQIAGGIVLLIIGIRILVTHIADHGVLS